MIKDLNVTQKFLDKKAKTKTINDPDSGLERYYTNDVTSELDSCLQGQKGSKAFKRMSRDDSMVGGLLKAYQNPIQSANWSIEEIPDATPKEQEIVDVLNQWFFKRNNFNELLGQILEMLPIGFSLFEKYYVPVDFEQGRYMMPILAERVQTSIRKIDYQDFTVEQQATDGNYVYIPFQDLVFFTFRQQGNDKRGLSLLRQAYYDYLDKKELKQASKKGIIRSMIGLAVGKTPENVRIDSKDYQAFEDMVMDIGKRNYDGLSDSAIMPSNYNIEILNSTGFDLKKMQEYLSYLDSTMATSVLTQFLTLGQNGNGGAYSLGRDQSDMLLDGLQFIIDYIEKTFNQTVIYQTVKMNWADVDPYKFKLVGNNLNKKNSKEFADTLAVLINSGLVKVEPEDEMKIRKMYGLPEIDIRQREKEDKQINEDVKSDQEATQEEEKQEEQEPQAKSDQVIKLSENWKNAKQRKEYKEQETDKISKFAKASLQLIADEFSKKVRSQLNKGNVEAQGLKDLKINNIPAYKRKMTNKIAGIAMQSWKNALKNSKGKLKLSEVKASDLPTQVLTSFVLNQVDTMVDKQMNDLREAAILSANTGATKGIPINNNMAMVDQKMDDYINNANRIDGGNELAIVQAMNYGEMEYYKVIEDELWGYRFTNDVPETDICKSLNGKTYPLNSSELDMVMPPLHFRCDSFLVPIYKSQEPKPDFDNFVPSDTILKQKTI